MSQNNIDYVKISLPKLIKKHDLNFIPKRIEVSEDGESIILWKEAKAGHKERLEKWKKDVEIGRYKKDKFKTFSEQIEEYGYTGKPKCNNCESVSCQEVDAETGEVTNCKELKIK